jgi:hypothetical protein
VKNLLTTPTLCSAPRAFPFIVFLLCLVMLSSQPLQAQFITNDPILTGTNLAQTIQIVLQKVDMAMTKYYTTQSFLQDNAFLQGLKKVKSGVQQYEQVKRIYTRQREIVDIVRRGIAQVQQNKNLKPQEIQYLVTYYSNLINESLETLSQVGKVLSNLFEMSDAERIGRIEQISRQVEVQRDKTKLTDESIKFQISIIDKNVREAQTRQQLLLNRHRPRKMPQIPY